MRGAKAQLQTAEIVSNNQIAAVASQKGAFVNLQNGRPVPIPDELQQKYLKYQQVIEDNI